MRHLAPFVFSSIAIRPQCMHVKRGDILSRDISVEKCAIQRIPVDKREWSQIKRKCIDYSPFHAPSSSIGSIFSTLGLILPILLEWNVVISSKNDVWSAMISKTVNGENLAKVQQFIMGQSGEIGSKTQNWPWLKYKRANLVALFQLVWSSASV